MSTIREGGLEFEFGPVWRVLKYDDNGSFYKTLMAKNIIPTKAVDFICLCDGAPLLMMEAKDFSRGVPQSDKFSKIPMVVAIKARDTIAGIVGGSHRATEPNDRKLFEASRDRLAHPPRVIFFFEDLATPARVIPQRVMNKRDVLLKQLREHFRWLTQEVAVVGLNDYRKFISDLTVRRIGSRAIVP